MSLLQQINERNQGRQQQAAEQEAEAAKPDAGQTEAAQSSQKSAELSAMPDQELQGEEPTAEEQQQFTSLEQQAVEILNSPQSGNAMLKAIMDSTDVVKGVASAASDITRSLKTKNPDASQDVLFGVGEAVVEMIVDLVEKADPQIDLSDDEMAESFGEAIQMYMKNNPEDVDEDTADYLNQAPPQANLGGLPDERTS
jgi:hypothetical protein